jgi:hypothetical protein
MGIVNRYAKGLLHILDSQTQGDTPSSMGDVIAPTMDLSEFLFASKRSDFGRATVTLAALGIASLQTVPAGEWWWLRNIGGEAVARDAVGSNIRWAIYLTTQSDNIPIAVSINALTAVVGSVNVVDPVHFPRPLVMVPGDQLVVQLLTVTGVPVLGHNFNCTWIYDRMTT